jgi:N-hydroxyarylamine O-acetyltransferase
MLLLVEVDRELFVCDVGFGGLTLTAPLRLAIGEAQATPHERFRLAHLHDDLVLEAEVRGEWRPVYRFDLQPQLQRDYEVWSWYLANHPASHFVTGLIAARPGDGCRYVLRNDVFAVHHVGGPTEERVLESVEEVRAVLEGTFGITLPDGAELDEALGRVVRGTVTT